MDPRNYYHPRWTLSGVALTLSTPHFFNFHCNKFFYFLPPVLPTGSQSWGYWRNCACIHGKYRSINCLALLAWNAL